MVNDQRGPQRLIVQVETDPNGGLTTLHLDCGHAVKANQIYSYRVGDKARCMACKREFDATCKFLGI
jgi:hypothetical protein